MILPTPAPFIDYHPVGFVPAAGRNWLKVQD
jgi:hypothetical protein